MTTLKQHQTDTAAPADDRTMVRRRLLTIGVATLAAVVVATIAGALGVDLAVDQGTTTETVTLGSVATFTPVVAFAGWGLLAALERWTTRGLRLWTGIAIGFALLSTVPPLAFGIGTAAKLTLFTLHLLVAAIVIPGFRGLTSS